MTLSYNDVQGLCVLRQCLIRPVTMGVDFTLVLFLMRTAHARFLSDATHGLMVTSWSSVVRQCLIRSVTMGAGKTLTSSLDSVLCLMRTAHALSDIYVKVSLSYDIVLLFSSVVGWCSRLWSVVVWCDIFCCDVVVCCVVVRYVVLWYVVFLVCSVVAVWG